VEGIEIDAELGSKFCSVAVVYGTNYSIDNYVILTTLISTYHQIATQLFKYSFTAHHLGQHVSSATLSSGRKTRMM